MKDIISWLCENNLYKNTLAPFSKNGNYGWYGLSGSQKSFFLSMAQHCLERPMLVLVRDKVHQQAWERDLRFLLPEYELCSFPLIDHIHFSTTAKSLENQSAQMKVLSALIEDKPIIVIATIEEGAQRIVDFDSLKKSIISLSSGDELHIPDLIRKLVEFGYERVEQVEQWGHFAIRGDIIDVFAVNMQNPVRIELFGDEIDTIRDFSLETQRSLTTLNNCSIVPLQVTVEDEASLLDYFKEGRIIYDDSNRLQESLKQFLQERKEHEDTCFTWRELMKHSKAAYTNFFHFLQPKSLPLVLKENHGIIAKSMVSFERQIPLLIDEVKQWIKEGVAVNIVLNNQQRTEIIVQELIKGNIPFSQAMSLQKKQGQVTIVKGLLTDGFELPTAKFIVITEQNIFGRQKRQLRKKVKKGEAINYFTDLTIGDYVVHSIHGIGKYVGLKNIETEGIHKDYLEIDYAGTDRLFLSVDNLGQIQKYIGHEGEAPRLHKMGGGEWQKVKQKAQKSIADLADKLTSLYAKREVVEGFAFPPDEPWQEEFEASFPFEETEDQLQAISEIKASMELPKPMDRLLCGDVGFGKTEVAMRAAFKTVMSGKQVAVLVPTTILAQQHYQTFVERFEPFGVCVEVLNRFRSTKERSETLALTKAGQCNILIGTHALLSKKVEFKDLGLLIVDEEQRFGVGQKEKWKEWATHIDVLTLSATPIPRTLHMSLVGVREMSVIHTPPEDRQPVQTYVLEYDMEVIVDAIRRELRRGGQVYFVYNRVASIQHMAELLEQAMPDLRYGIAHGQMSGSQIERIMVDFYEGEHDVLLCTSIVENGLDVPNANTIIVYDADRLGLSQLYQMRGRVGRSGKRAYAYFMYRPDKALAETAEKRLQAIKEFTELGAGFKLAMRDLEIRGAGNLLGAQQHGNIAAVGFALYCTMLEEAIAKVKDKPIEKKIIIEPTIDLQIDAFIDDAYVSDQTRKIMLYQRMLQIKSMADLEDFVDEIVDRFGTPTQPVEKLLRLAMIKERARLLGIKSMIVRQNELSIHWEDDRSMAEWNMGAVDALYWKAMRILPTKPTSMKVKLGQLTASVLSSVEKILTELEKR